MKSLGCTIWMLGALLVIATLDARPDPPAMAPHSVKAKGSCEYSGEDGVQKLSCESSKFMPGLRPHWVRRADVGEPDRTTGGLAVVRHAADSSPPA